MSVETAAAAEQRPQPPGLQPRGPQPPGPQTSDRRLCTTRLPAARLTFTMVAVVIALLSTLLTPAGAQVQQIDVSASVVYDRDKNPQIYVEFSTANISWDQVRNYTVNWNAVNQGQDLLPNFVGPDESDPVPWSFAEFSEIAVPGQYEVVVTATMFDDTTRRGSDVVIVQQAPRIFEAELREDGIMVRWLSGIQNPTRQELVWLDSLSSTTVPLGPDDRSYLIPDDDLAFGETIEITVSAIYPPQSPLQNFDLLLQSERSRVTLPQEATPPPPPPPPAPTPAPTPEPEPTPAPTPTPEPTPEPAPTPEPEPVNIGPVADATTLAEIINATDYQPSDADLLRLYQAFFNREPDVEGAKYWIDISRQGSTLLEIAEFFTGVPEYQNLYAGSTNAQFVERVYTNVLGRNFDQDGYDYWLSLLNDGQLSRGGTVRWITASDEFKNAYPFLP